jgi:hypothetical protein
MEDGEVAGLPIERDGNPREIAQQPRSYRGHRERFGKPRIGCCRLHLADDALADEDGTAQAPADARERLLDRCRGRRVIRQSEIGISGADRR